MLPCNPLVLHTYMYSEQLEDSMLAALEAAVNSFVSWSFELADTSVCMPSTLDVMTAQHTGTHAFARHRALLLPNVHALGAVTATQAH